MDCKFNHSNENQIKNDLLQIRKAIDELKKQQAKIIAALESTAGRTF